MALGVDAFNGGRLVVASCNGMVQLWDASAPPGTVSTGAPRAGAPAELEGTTASCMSQLLWSSRSVHQGLYTSGMAMHGVEGLSEDQLALLALYDDPGTGTEESDPPEPESDSDEDAGGTGLN